MSPREPYQQAALVARDWLDARPECTRSRGRAENGKLSWDVQLPGEGAPVHHFRLVLPADFPATPCEIYVAPALCLGLPHVEETGRVCLSESHQAEDYDRPVDAVCRVIAKFQSLLTDWNRPDWVQEEFQRERLSYWGRHCQKQRKAVGGLPVPARSYVQAPRLERWTEGEVAAYVEPGAKGATPVLQVIGYSEPHALAQRHGWAAGTLVKGNVLYVRLPEDALWIPTSWPETFFDLANLVDAGSGEADLLISWLSRCGWTTGIEKVRSTRKGRKRLGDPHAPRGLKPLLVVLVDGSAFYGYRLLPPTVSRMTSPSIAPFELIRVDASWCLTRDHESERFAKRQSLKILVLGGGSLGSPVADILARSGIGHIYIVDPETFDGPNTGRHSLGLCSIHRSKAIALAERISKEVPGIFVKGHQVPASRFLMESYTSGDYDLVVDCTAEGAVRMFIANMREAVIGDISVLHAWVEPYCAAAHAVLTTRTCPWPADDHAVSKIRAADFSSAQHQVQIPACGGGFHPYGAADIIQAAGFVAERILEVLDSNERNATVWSWVRAKAYFDSLPVPVRTTDIVPTSGSRSDAVHLTRRLTDVLSTG